MSFDSHLSTDLNEANKMSLAACVLSQQDPLHHWFNCSSLSLSSCQVHDLDEQTWRTVEVVPIDIANKEEVATAVSLKLLN